MASYTEADEAQNFFRLVSLLTDTGASVLRQLLKDHVRKQSGSPDLDKHLSFHKTTIESLKKRRILDKSQLDLLFPPCNTPVDVEKWDVTLLSCVIGNTCNLSFAKTNELNDLRALRNKVCGHISRASVDESTFKLLWTEISTVVTKVASWSSDPKFTNDISDNIQTLLINPKFLRPSTSVLHKWVHMDEEIKGRLKEVEDSIESITKKMKTQPQQMQNMLDHQRDDIREELTHRDKTLTQQLDKSVEKHQTAMKRKFSEHSTSCAKLLDKRDQEHLRIVRDKISCKKKKMMEEVDEQMHVLKQDIDKKIDEQKNIVKSEEKAINRLEEKVVDHSTALASEEKRINKLESERSELKLQLASKGKRIGKLESERNKQESRLASKGKRIDKLESERNVQMSQIASKGKRLDKLECERTEQMSQIASKGKRIDKLESERKDQMSLIASKGKRIDKLESERKEQMSQIASKGKRIDNLESERKEQMSLIASKGKRIDKLESERKEQMSLIASKGKRIDKLESERNEQMSHIASKGKRIDQLESERKKQMSVIASKGKRLDRLESEVNKQKCHMSSKEERNKQLETMLSEQNEKVSSSQKKVEDLESKLEEQKDYVSQMISEQNKKMSKLFEMYQAQNRQHIEKETSELHEANMSKQIKLSKSNLTTRKETKEHRRTATGENATSAKTAEVFLQSKSNIACVKTKLMCVAEQKLKDNGCVVISGGPGEGKTITGATILASTVGKDRCIVLRNARDLDTVDISETAGVFIDDIFGATQLDKRKLKDWFDVLPELQKSVENGKLKLVIATRGNILEECLTKMKRFRIFNHIIEFSSSKMLREEKIEILTLLLHKHEKKMHSLVVSKCVDLFTSSIGFLLCCHLFCTNDSLYELGAGFFSMPYIFFKDNLGKLDKLQYTSLVYMFCRGGEVPISDFTDQSKLQEFETILNTIVQTFDNQQDKTVVTTACVKRSLEDMKDVYIEQTSSSFIFMHTVIAETIGLLFGCKNPDTTIKVCSSDFLRHCTLLDQTLNSPEELFVPKQSYRVLAERFIDEVIKEGNVQKTAEHPAFQHAPFLSVFMKVMEDTHLTESFFKTRQEDISNTELCFFSELVRVTPNHVIGSLTVIVDLLVSCCECTADVSRCWRCLQLQEAASNSYGHSKLHHFLLLMNYGAVVSTEEVQSMFKEFSDDNFMEAMANVQQCKPLNFPLLRLLLEEAYKCNNIGLVKVMITQDAEVTSKILNIATVTNNLELLQIAIQKLKSESRFNAKNSHITEAVEHSFKTCNVQTAHLLLAEGATVTPMCVYIAAAAENLRLWKLAVKHYIHLETSANTDDLLRKTTDAVFSTNNKEMSQVLLSNDSLITHRCTYWAVKDNDMSLLNRIFHSLKSQGRWLVDNDYTKSAICEAFKENNKELIEFLLNHGILATPECVHLSVSHGEVALLKASIQNLKTEGRWKQDEPEIQKLLVDAYEVNDKAMIHVLMNEGVPFSPQCVFFATLNNEESLLKSAIHNLKIRDTWNPDDSIYNKTIFEAFKEYADSTVIIDVLLSEGVPVTPECLLQAVLSKQTRLFIKTMKNLQSTNQWRTDSKYVRDVLLKTHFAKMREMTATLLREGVKDISLTETSSVATELLCWSVTLNDIEAMKIAVKSLKQARAWSIYNVHIHNSVLIAHKNSNKDMVETFKSDNSLFTPETVEWAVTNNDTIVVKLAIDSLKSRKMLQEDGRELFFALEKTFENSNIEMINIFLEAGIYVTRKCLYTALNQKNVYLIQKTIKKMKKIDTWSELNNEFSKLVKYGSKDLNDEIVSIMYLVERCFKTQSKEIIEVLMQEDISLTAKCIYYSVDNGDISSAEKGIIQMKNAGTWDVKHNDIRKAMERAFVTNRDMSEVLQAHGVLLTSGCVYDFTLKNEPESVKHAIRSLKFSEQWDPHDRDLARALEKAYEMSIKEIIDILSDEGVAVTFECVNWALKHGEIATVCKTVEALKLKENWDKESCMLTEGVEAAFSNNSKEIIHYLDNEKIRLTHRCVYLAVANGEKAIAYSAIQALKSTGEWNLAHGYVKSAIDEAYEGANKEIIGMLLTEGVQVTPRCVYWSVSNEELDTVKTIKLLQLSGQWDPDHTDMTLAIEGAYKINNKEIIEMLVTEGVKATHGCVYKAVCNECPPMVKRAINNLKSSGKWDVDNEDISEAIEETYRLHNNELMNFLTCEGVQVTHRCVYLAMCNKDAATVQRTIHTLKLSGRWDPVDRHVSLTIEKAYQMNSEEMINILKTEGVYVTSRCVYWAVCNMEATTLKAIIQRLKSLKLWDQSDTNVRKATEKAYEINSQEIINVLLAEGVHVTHKCVFWAVFNKEHTNVKTTIEDLKSSGQWDPSQGESRKAIETAYEINNKDIINILQTEGVPVTPRCVYLYKCRLVSTAIHTMKSSKRWDTTNVHVRNAIEKACLKNNEELVNILLTEGVEITQTYIYWAVCSNKLTTVRTAIQSLRSSGQWNPSSEAVISALEMALWKGNKAVINLLMTEGAQITYRCVFWAVGSKDPTIVKTTIEALKSSGQWDPCHCGVTEVIEKAYGIDSKDIIEILLAEGVQSTHRCVFFTVCNKRPTTMQTTIAALKSSKQWNPGSVHITEAIEKAYEINNKEIIKSLLTEGVQVTHRCVYLAVCNKESNTVSTTIQALKSAGQWDPGNGDSAIETAYWINNAEIIKVLLTEGIHVTHMCVYWAVYNNESTTVQTVIEDLKTSEQWDSKNEDLSKTIEKAFEIDNKEIIDILLNEGVQVTHECVCCAIRNQKPTNLQTTLKILKRSGQWDPEHADVTKAIELAYHTNNKKKINILLAEEVMATHDCVLSTVLNEEPSMVQTAIQSLKSSGKWDPSHIKVIRAIENAYLINNREIINILLAEEVMATHDCVLSTVLNEEPSMVQTAIQSLKSSGKWDPSHVKVIRAIENAYLTNNREIINILLAERVQVTHSFVCLAVSSNEPSTVQTAIQTLKSSEQWDPDNRDVTSAIEMAYKIKSEEIINLLLSEGARVTHRCILLTIDDEELNTTQTTTQI